MSERFKLKLLPRTTLKGKVSTHFPASVVGLPPISVTQSGLSYTIGLNVNQLLNQLPSLRDAGIIAVFDGGAIPIPTGVGVDIEVPFNCTINECNMYAVQSGDLIVDIWKDSHANFPPTLADSITASAKPTITASNKSQDSTLTGWNTSIAAGDILRFNIDFVSNIIKATVVLEVSKS